MNREFVSVRWKLVSTYLLLIVLTMVITTSFYYNSLLTNDLNSAESDLFREGNIISNQISINMDPDGNHQISSIERTIKQRSLEWLTRVIVVDKEGYVLADSNDDYDGVYFNYLPEVSEGLNGHNSFNAYRTQDDRYVLYSSVPVVKNSEVIGTVFMSSPGDSIFANAEDIVGKIAFLSMLSIAITGVVAFFFTDMMATPIEKLTELVNQIALGKHDVKYQITGNDEIADLGRAFNLMSTKLDQIDSRRKKFVSNVSHELRTPMTSMKIISDSLLAQESWDEEIYRSFLQDIDSEVMRLNTMIDSLLYLVQVEKDEFELDLKMTHFNYLIKSIIKTLKPIADKKNIDLEFNDLFEVHLTMDENKMYRCVLNIIENGIKYTPEGGAVKVRLDSLREYVVLTITDTGIGIPEKDIEFIFDRFYRTDQHRNRKTGGVGLGMSIAHQIVQLHQGTIEVESTVGQGTAIKIKLPRKGVLG